MRHETGQYIFDFYSQDTNMWEQSKQMMWIYLWHITIATNSCIL